MKVADHSTTHLDSVVNVEIEYGKHKVTVAMFVMDFAAEAGIILGDRPSLGIHLAGLRFEPLLQDDSITDDDTVLTESDRLCV